MQSPTWAANWFAASQEIPRISRNPNVHYRTHKRPPTVSILGQPNPVHIPSSHLLEIHPNIIHPSTPRSLQWSLSLLFPHQDPIHPPHQTHTRHMPSPSHSRPITLLNAAYKIFAITLNQRLVDIIESELGNYQSGFRPNRSTIENVFKRQIIEKCYEYDIDIHNIFIDYTHAFDSIKRNKISYSLTFWRRNYFFNCSTPCI